MIIGQPGSGKSSLARVLGERVGLPVHHVDKIHWKSGWVERDRDEKLHLISKVEAESHWIIEGGLSKTWENRVSRADTLIWLDVPLAIRAWRVLKRRIVYHGRSRPDLPKGCPEKIHLDFAVWIWSTRNSARAEMEALFNTAPPPKSRFCLKTGTQVKQFVSTLAENAGSTDP